MPTEPVPPEPVPPEPVPPEPVPPEPLPAGPSAAADLYAPNWRIYRTLTEGDPLRQPDATTCGSSSLVMAQMINHPDFASTILDPDRTAGGTTPNAFAAAVLRTHHRTGRFRDERGVLSVPWPAFLGTHPWAVARHMSGPAGHGRTPARYVVRVVDPAQARAEYLRIVRAVDAGDVVPLFVGNALMARHVVLVTGHHDLPEPGLDVYEPAAGRWVDLARSRWLAGNVDIAGWSEAWFAVLPSSQPGAGV